MNVSLRSIRVCPGALSSDWRNRGGGDFYLLWQKMRKHYEHREFVNNWDQIGFGIGVIRKPMSDFPLPDEI